MKIQKKHIIAASIALLSISAATLYLQYKKLMDYTLGFSKLKIKTLTQKLFSLDVILTFTNKSTLGFVLTSQKYDIYIEGVYLATLKNEADVKINPRSTSNLTLGFEFNPKQLLDKLKIAAPALLLKGNELKVRIDSDIKIKWGVLSPRIKYSFEDTLKNLMA